MRKLIKWAWRLTLLYALWSLAARVVVPVARTGQAGRQEGVRVIGGADGPTAIYYVGKRVSRSR